MRNVDSLARGALLMFLQVLLYHLNGNIEN
jgi:hypothetical protein